MAARGGMAVGCPCVGWVGVCVAGGLLEKCGAGGGVVALFGGGGSLCVGVVRDRGTGIGVVRGDVVAPFGSVVGCLLVAGVRGDDVVAGFGRGRGIGEWSGKGCVDMVGVDVGGWRACRRRVDPGTTGWAETLMWTGVVV